MSDNLAPYKRMIANLGDEAVAEELFTRDSIIERLRDENRSMEEHIHHIGIMFAEHGDQLKTLRAENSDLKRLLNETFGSGWEEFDAAALYVCERKLREANTEVAALKGNAERASICSVCGIDRQHEACKGNPFQCP